MMPPIARRGRLPKPSLLSPLIDAVGSVQRTGELLQVSRWRLQRWNKTKAIPRAYRVLVNVWCKHLGVDFIFPDEIRLSELQGLGYLSKLPPHAKDVVPQSSGTAKVSARKRKPNSKEKQSWRMKQ